MRTNREKEREKLTDEDKRRERERGEQTSSETGEENKR